jgi:hypothetical protein
VSKQHSDYKKLRAKWYAKLKKSGFEDIESDDDNLKDWSSKFEREKSLTSWKAKESYYYMATSFLNSYRFVTELEKAIWEYHSNGLSHATIANLLKKTKIKTNRTTVGLVIKRLRQIMQS